MGILTRMSITVQNATKRYCWSNHFTKNRLPESNRTILCDQPRNQSPEELALSVLCCGVELSRKQREHAATGNDYRRIGIVRNPQLYANQQCWTGNVYSQTLDLTHFLICTFATDEIVKRAYSNAWGVCC